MLGRPQGRPCSTFIRGMHRCSAPWAEHRAGGWGAELPPATSHAALELALLLVKGLGS